MGLAVHSDLSRLHGLQQSRLSPGRGPVQLIGQKHIGHHRTGLVDHGPGLLLIDRIASDIRWQHVRRKLDPAIVQAQGLGKGQGHGGLAHAGNVLQQDMSPGQNGG